MGRLQGKAAIVTGAGTGLGEATARLLASEGAAVIVADIDPAGGARVAGEIAAAGGQAASCVFDLGDEASVRAMIEAATARFGGLDVLVNNAAKTSLVPRDTTIEAIDLEVWDETMRTNLRGTMLACRHAIPAMRARGGGAIVNIASGAALRGSGQLSAYGVSKAAIDSLSRYVAAQVGPEGIRCNTIAPGIMLTPTTMPSFGAEHVQPRVKKMLLSPRLGQPEDIAAAVLWLAADSGAFVNGQCIQVDGGMLGHTNFTRDFFA